MAFWVASYPDGAARRMRAGSRASHALQPARWLRDPLGLASRLALRAESGDVKLLCQGNIMTVSAQCLVKIRPGCAAVGWEHHHHHHHHLLILHRS